VYELRKVGTSLAGLLAMACLFSAQAVAGPEATNELRVCADPNNMPFSNREHAGFENKIAELAALKLGKTLSYTWWAQRRGFIRHTLKAGLCDLVIGVPAHYDLVENTRPYYRSTYVFVSQTDRKLQLSSIEDPRLKRLTIGVHLIGDDGNNTPPAHALGDQGIVENVRGYMIYGDYREPNPPARLIEAVEHGDVDVAAAWGPLAGYAAKTSSVPLSITPIQGGEPFAPLRFQFDIAMGVRKGDHVLRDRLNDFLAQNAVEITSLLESYGVPLVENNRSATSENQPK
jgi:mxaJ protein